jgi:hypothetical protein
MKERKVEVGKGLHWKWESTLKVENSYQKTKFANKVIMFGETLEFKQVILLCYGKDKT